MTSHYTRSQLEAMAAKAAVAHGVNPKVFKAQIEKESSFNPWALSPKKAMGIAQITRATAKDWHVNPYDPQAALNAAAKNMSRYIRKHRKQGHDERTALKKALVDYNCGPYCGNRKNAESRNYISEIFRRAGL